MSRQSSSGGGSNAEEDTVQQELGVKSRRVTSTTAMEAMMQTAKEG